MQKVQLCKLVTSPTKKTFTKRTFRKEHHREEAREMHHKGPG